MGPCGPEVEEAISAALAAGGFTLSGALYGAAERRGGHGDKKRAGGEITLVLPREIGRCELRRYAGGGSGGNLRAAVGA